jgi:hypothetical protein
LTLSLRLDAEHVGRDVADDPMMVELIALLSIIQTVGTPPPVLAAPVEDEAPKMSSPGHSCGSLGLDAGSAGRDVAEDPMMVEVVVALPIIQTAGAPTEHEAPRAPASPVRGCGSPHTDRPALDSSRDGALVSFIDAIKLPLEQPLMVSPLRLRIKDPKAADDGDFIPSAASV